MADTIEDILARKSGQESLEQILARKNIATQTYPPTPIDQPPTPPLLGQRRETPSTADVARPEPLAQGVRASTGMLPSPRLLPEEHPERDAPTAILEFLAEAAVFRGGGRLGEAVAGQVTKRLPSLMRFLGRTTGFAGTDIALDVAQGESPSPIKAATVGAVGAGLESGMEIVGRGLARGGKVPRQVVSETLQKTTAGRAAEMLGGVAPETQLAEAGRVGAGVRRAIATKSPGRREAEAMIKAADDITLNQGVDTMPIKQEIVKHIRRDQPILGTQSQVNAQLETLESQIPERLTFAQLDSLIRQLAEPVKGQIGNVEVRLPTQVRKQILMAAKEYRNQVLPGAAEGFRKAEQYLSAVKDLNRRMFDAKGRLKDSAPTIWRTSFQKPTVQKALQEFDRVTGGQYGAVERGRALARKSFWSPDDGETAEGLLLAGIGWFGRATLFLGRGTGKAAIIASRPSGVVGSVTARELAEESP